MLELVELVIPTVLSVMELMKTNVLLVVMTLYSKEMNVLLFVMKDNSFLKDKLLPTTLYYYTVKNVLTLVQFVKEKINA